jgi:hypothetical protein
MNRVSPAVVFNGDHSPKLLVAQIHVPHWKNALASVSASSSVVLLSRSAVVPPGSSTLVVGVEILCVPLCSHVIVDALIDLCGALIIESCKRVAGRYKI